MERYPDKLERKETVKDVKSFMVMCEDDFHEGGLYIKYCEVFMRVFADNPTLPTEEGWQAFDRVYRKEIDQHAATGCGNSLRLAGPIVGGRY